VNKFRRKIENCYYSFSNFFQNIGFFIKLAWRWRSWDQSYNIDAFCDIMEESAKRIRRYGNTVGKEKCYRRMMQGSGQLRRAYQDYKDPTSVYLYRKSPLYATLRQDGVEISNTPKHIHDAMYKIAQEREKRVGEERKKYAWNYLNKWSDDWWD